MVKKIVQNNLGVGLDLRECAGESNAEFAEREKIVRSSFPKASESKSAMVGDLIHTDLCGPFEVATPSGKCYFIPRWTTSVVTVCCIC